MGGNTWTIVAMLLGILFLMLLVIKTRIKAFPALILSAILIGLLSGFTATETIGPATPGFGGTLSRTGIVLGREGGAGVAAVLILVAVGIGLNFLLAHKKSS